MSGFAFFGLPWMAMGIGEPWSLRAFRASMRERDGEPPLPKGVGCEDCGRGHRGVHTESWERGRLLCTVCGPAFIQGSAA